MNKRILNKIKYFDKQFCLEIDFSKGDSKIIQDFSDRVDWNWISYYHRLSEMFIRKFADNVDWIWVCCFQKLSEKFIREFSSKVHWDILIKRDDLSEEFKNKIKLFL